MRLREIRIENFRSFEDQTIHLDAYTCLVGPNGSGKSTVLQALNVFFRNSTSSPLNLLTLSQQDFHHKDTSKPVKITLTFDDLSQEAQEEFKAYFRNGKLVISAIAEWNAASGSAEVEQYGSRMVMKAFAPFFEAVQNKALVPELKKIFSELQKQFSDLPKAATKNDMETVLRTYEEEHPERGELLESPNQFYGWSKGENRLRKYFQWIYVPAVKDPSTEQDEGRATALGQLLERTVRAKVSFETKLNELRQDLAQKYEDMIAKEQVVLGELGNSLTKRIREWTHSGTQIQVGWHYDREKSIMVNEPRARIAVGEDQFLGEIARLGHGLQRTVFVSLLQELAEQEQADIPTLLLGFEEPELYQHPPQARHMSSLLEELSGKNSQIILTTHSPYFVSGKGFENIRMIRKSADDRESIGSKVTHEEISKKIGAALNEEPRTPTSMMAAVEQIMQPSQNELFFASIVILVEGIEDVAFISSYLNLTGLWNEFRRHGCHFVVAGGKVSLSRPLAIAQGLGIPVFVVFDSDAVANREKPGDHPRNNGCILSLCGIANGEPMPQETFWGDNAVMWHSDIMDVVRSDIGAAVWGEAEQKAKKDHGFLEGVTRKNKLLIAATLEELLRKGHKLPVLERLCMTLLDFASKH